MAHNTTRADSKDRGRVVLGRAPSSASSGTCCSMPLICYCYLLKNLMQVPPTTLRVERFLCEAIAALLLQRSQAPPAVGQFKLRAREGL